MNHDILSIRVRHEPGYTIIVAAGEIDIFTVSRLRDQLFTVASDGLPLIADLDRVIFIGAAGLGALADAARRAAARGTSLHVVCARPQTRQLLQLTGLDRTLRLARSLAEALQASQPPRTAARTTRPPEPVPAPLGGDD